MRIQPFLTVGLLTVVLSGCAASPSDVSINQTSSSSVSSVTVASSSSAGPYTGPFMCGGETQCIGNFTVKGYPVIVTQTESPEYHGCGDHCLSYQYVYFRITEGMTQPILAFLDKTRGNAYVQEDALGLGCVWKKKENNERETIGSIRDIPSEDLTIETNPEDASTILQATADAPVSLVFSIPIEAEGHGAPICYSHFYFEVAKD